MSRRVLINLGVFVLMFAVLTQWAVVKIVRLDALEKPLRIYAEFETSPGLRGGFAVTYYGVQVGRIGGVNLHGGVVRAELKIDRDQELPAELSAEVMRRSAVGEPYINLTPVTGVDPGGPRVTKGEVIPSERTKTPVPYSEVFQSFDDLLAALPSAELGRLVSVLADGIEGRAPEMRAIIRNSSDVAASFAAAEPTLTGLTEDLTRLTKTLADHSGEFSTSWDAVAALSTTLRERNATLTHLLASAPTLTEQVEQLLTSTGPLADCLFDQGAQIWTTLATKENQQRFRETIDLAGPAADVVSKMLYQGPDGLYLNSIVTLSLGSYTKFPEPLKLPEPPTVGDCQGLLATGTFGNPADAISGTGSETRSRVGDTPTDVPGRVTTSTTIEPSSTADTPDGVDLGRLFRLGLLAAAIVVAVLALAGARPWHHLAAWRRRKEDR